jgi:sulfur carrier protein ThiS
MIIVNDRPMDWQPGMTLADAIRAYTQYDSLIYINPDLMVIIGNRRYSDQEVESVVLEDETRIILMYEFWGG